MKKLLCWLALLCLLAPTLPALADADGAHAITGRTVDFYYGDIECVVPHAVCFIDGSDVPFLALSQWQAILHDYIGFDSYGAEILADGSLRFDFSMVGNTGVLTREDGYTAAFDCDADTIRFLDYDAFLRLRSDDLLTDMVGSLHSTGGDSVRYFLRTGASSERYGREVVLNAADYGIDFIAQGGECYVPMQTLSDFLLANYSGCIFWNGEFAVVGPSTTFGTADSLTPLGEKYYSVAPRDRSEAMARFSYGELCMALDALYGMRESHGIDDFDGLVEDTGLKADLTGTDAVRASAGLYQLLMLHLDDIHTAFRLPSPLAGVHAADGFGDELGSGPSRSDFLSQWRLYSDARDAVRPDGVPGYEEIGNTAFITPESFQDVPAGVDYYETPPTSEAEDTLGIMIYAYGQITREDSPIENVVLDLSLNKGGMANAAIFTLAAFLGTGAMSTKNVLTGATVTGSYRIDINLDGKADEGDLGLKDKNLFCIESPFTFSCANLVSCAFKASNRVSLLGRASGGGACFVQSLSTADGACCQISGAVQMSFLKNGSFYDNDRGAEPDLPLLKPKSFYNRKALAEYINAIM